MKLSAHRARLEHHIIRIYCLFTVLRSAFKKWLAVEKQVGDQNSVETVKSRAQDWRQKETVLET